MRKECGYITNDGTSRYHKPWPYMEKRTSRYHKPWPYMERRTSRPYMEKRTSRHHKPWPYMENRRRWKGYIKTSEKQKKRTKSSSKQQPTHEIADLLWLHHEHQRYLDNYRSTISSICKTFTKSITRHGAEGVVYASIYYNRVISPPVQIHHYFRRWLVTISYPINYLVILYYH